MFPEIEQYIESLQEDQVEITSDRQQLLDGLKQFIQQSITADEQVRLIFICTHNSRRSHMAQVWAQTLASFYDIPYVQTYSGGTEATAFNPHAIAALKDCGFTIIMQVESENPVYEVCFSNEDPSLIAFSKVYSSEENPQKDFAAIMVCDEADEACPVVFGATKRFSISYTDPKAYDGTSEQEEQYANTCRIIASEMNYIFSRISV